MKFSQKQIMILGGAIVAVLVLVGLVFFNLRGKTDPQEVKLTLWGTEKEEAYENIFYGYSRLKPNVTFEYRKISENEYEETLIDALAGGNGPDIFLISHTDLRRMKNKITPADPLLISPGSIENYFPLVVFQDFVFDGGIYAIPLEMDSLALIYNRDLLDQASIVGPPQNWQEFQNMIPYLRKTNESGQLEKSAGAIGGSSKTVKYAKDLLSAIMIQNGVTMYSEEVLSPEDKALQAFNFYLQFANSSSPHYTWNDLKSPDQESFVNGNVAMIFGYYSDYVRLKEENPYLNIGITFLPRVGSDSRSYASYRGLTVSAQSKNKGWAWDFIVGATTNPQIAEGYMKATGSPPAHKTLIGAKINDPVLGIFARQALTARSWVQADEVQVKRIFDEGIGSVLSGAMDSSRALDQIKGRLIRLD